LGYTCMKTALISILLSVTLVLAFMVPAGVASLETRVYVDPSETLVLVGETFVIYVKIADVINLYGYDIWLRYDTSILDVLSVGPPHMLPEPMIEIIEPEGIIHIYKILFPPAMPISGSGTVASITFNATAPGNCILDLFSVTLYDPNYISIPHSCMDGSVTVEADMSDPSTGGIAILVAVPIWL